MVPQVCLLEYFQHFCFRASFWKFCSVCLLESCQHFLIQTVGLDFEDFIGVYSWVSATCSASGLASSWCLLEFVQLFPQLSQSHNGLQERITHTKNIIVKKFRPIFYMLHYQCKLSMCFMKFGVLTCRSVLPESPHCSCNCVWQASAKQSHWHHHVTCFRCG